MAELVSEKYCLFLYKPATHNVGLSTHSQLTLNRCWVHSTEIPSHLASGCEQKSGPCPFGQSKHVHCAKKAGFQGFDWVVPANMSDQPAYLCKQIWLAHEC